MFDKNGVLLINKPYGESSFKQISKIRKILNIKKVGHCGTLDPLATGLLVLCINKATRISNYLLSDDKAYIGEVSFGHSTTTDDLEGNILNKSDKKITTIDLENILCKFTGNIEQIPPKFSAVKIKGKKAYELARKDKKFEISKRLIYIESIDILSFDEISQKALLEIKCSKGTYIRSLARDMGEALGTYAHLSSLKRIISGEFILNSNNCINDIDNANIDIIEKKLISMNDALTKLNRLVCDKNSLTKVEFGRKLNYTDILWDESDINKNNIDNDKHYKLVYNNKLIALLNSDLTYRCVFMNNNI